MPTGERAGSVDQRRERVANEAPLFVIRRAFEGDAEGLGAVTRHRDREERAEDHGVLGLGLHTDAIRTEGPGTVATKNRPDDGDGEDEAGSVADERVGLVHAAFEELERCRYLMVDLQDCGHAEQNDETEVHHRMHDSGAGLAQKCLHVQARTEVSHALLDVLLGGRPVVGATALPVLHPQGEDPRSVNDDHR